MSFNVPEFSVTEFSRTVKRIVEDAFGYVRIKGEVTGCKKAASGHLYFSLKDEEAVLSAVCFRNIANLIDFEMADGLQVVVSGKITTFEGRSNYQIIVEKVEISGIGAILEMIEKRRKKLAAEGLFDDIHKEKIPFFPKMIGIITSETGSVLQDMKHRITQRCPSHIKLYPSMVQGKKAPEEIIKAIKYFNKLKKADKPDILIIARGGGSFEDLLPFNDEALVRAVFASDIPIISAIGHETDTSLIDYVSDLRAPTPTAAAEFATPILDDLKNQLHFLDDRLHRATQNILTQQRDKIKNLQKYIISPERYFQQMNDSYRSLEKRFLSAYFSLIHYKSQKLAATQLSVDNILTKMHTIKQRHNHYVHQLDMIVDNNIKAKKNSLASLEKLLKAHHYREILKRGFSLVKNDKGHIISSLSQIKPKEHIITELGDGSFSSYILDINNKAIKADGDKKKASNDNLQPKLI